MRNFDERYDPENDKRAFGTLALIIAAMICGLVLSALTGCKTQERIQIVERVRTDTLYQSKVQRDSIYVERHDSTATYIKGDTVTVEKWHWRDRWRERLLTDTVYQSKTDSVPVPYPVEVIKEVPAEFTFWQRFKMLCGTIFLCAIGGGVILWIIKKKFLS